METTYPSSSSIHGDPSLGGFSLGKPEDLPPSRRELYDKSNRRSQVLVKSVKV